MQLNFKFPRTNVLCDAEENKCKIAKSICVALGELMQLPEKLTIEFVEMPPHTYADSSLDNTSSNLIRLSLALSVNELMIPLVHELIHVNQMYEGRLMITYAGIFIWDKVPYEIDLTEIDYKEYLMLPWELDVAQKQPVLMKEILKSYM